MTATTLAHPPFDSRSMILDQSGITSGVPKKATYTKSSLSSPHSTLEREGSLAGPHMSMMACRRRERGLTGQRAVRAEIGSVGQQPDRAGPTGAWSYRSGPWPCRQHHPR